MFILLKGAKMSFLKKCKKKEVIDEQIYKRFEHLDNTIGDSEEDAKEIHKLKELVECRDRFEDKPKFTFDINLGTIISSGFGLLSILALIAHERDGVIASKISQIIPVSRFLK